MKVVVLDDEMLAIKRLVKCIHEVDTEAEIVSFNSALEVLSYAKEHLIDVVFLDIRGMDMDGITLAKKLKVLHPHLNVIFSTGYSEYALEAMDLYASGYLLKPITVDKVRKALEELRYPVKTIENSFRIQCFGNFEAFIDGVPVPFQHIKTKELLAYLYDRKGAVCTVGEIMTALWEDDRDHSNYLKQLRKDLLDTLKIYKLEHLIVKQRGGISILYDKIDSDLKAWDNDNAIGINAYHGEYMAQYSWAEVTAAAMYMQYADHK